VFPSLFVLPDSLSFVPHEYGVIGFGDVAIFCLLAISAARFGKKINSRVPVVVTFAGFAVAMILCDAIMRIFNSGQPATIYIVPLCALPVMLYAKWHGSFDQLSRPFYRSFFVDK
jgi:hypothetical protein